MHRRNDTLARKAVATGTAVHRVREQETQFLREQRCTEEMVREQETQFLREQRRREEMVREQEKQFLRELRRTEEMIREQEKKVLLKEEQGRKENTKKPEQQIASLLKQELQKQQELRAVGIAAIKASSSSTVRSDQTKAELAVRSANTKAALAVRSAQTKAALAVRSAQTKAELAVRSAQTKTALAVRSAQTKAEPVTQTKVGSSSMPLKEVSAKDFAVVLENLSFSSLVDPFLKNGVSGKALSRIASHKDIMDIDKNNISMILAKTFFEDYLVEWKATGLVSKKLLQKRLSTSQPASAVITPSSEVCNSFMMIAIVK